MWMQMACIYGRSLYTYSAYIPKDDERLTSRDAGGDTHHMCLPLLTKEELFRNSLTV